MAPDLAPGWETTADPRAVEAVLEFHGVARQAVELHDPDAIAHLHLACEQGNADACAVLGDVRLAGDM